MDNRLLEISVVYGTWERNNIAASYSAQGESSAQKIRNETDRTVTVMEADARKQADILEAEGEAEYMRILQEAYNDPGKADFYNFTRSLDALKEAFSRGDKTILLDRDSELAGLLYGTGLDDTKAAAPKTAPETKEED